MKPVYHLPGQTARDLVTEIRQKRKAAKLKKRLNRCLGIGSCDCPHCK